MRNVVLVSSMLLLGLGTTCFGEDGITIRGAQRLVDTDWMEKQETFEVGRSGIQTGASTTTYRVLSFRPGDTWDEGLLWAFYTRHHIARNGTVSGSTSAYKGRYSITAQEEIGEAILILNLSFERVYTAVDPEAANFELNTKFLPEGARIELTLDDGNTVPKRDLKFSIIKGFYVDEQGRETVRRYSPDGILEKVVGQGEVRKLRSLSFASIGSTLRMNECDLNLDKPDSSPPPTYRPRAKRDE
jgi:hypothetical protein